MCINRFSVFHACLCNCRSVMYITYFLYGTASPVYVLKTNINSGLLFNHTFKDFRLLYSVDSKFVNKDNKDSANKKPASEKPKKEIKTYITLIGIDKNISVTTVEDASKLATRRNFKLVKMMDYDTKSSRAVYQFMTESQYLKEDKEWDDPKAETEKIIKGNKVVSFSSGISQNDLLTKVKSMKKWLAKKFEVRVVITGDTTVGENVYKIIEKDIATDGRIVQKRIKGSDVRFQILPPKKTEEKKPVDVKKEST